MDGSRASMLEILAFIEAERTRGSTTIELDVLDPDRGRGLFAGETVVIDGTTYIHRPLSAWVELAERLGLRLATPRAIDALTNATAHAGDDSLAATATPHHLRLVNADHMLRLRFEVLDRATLVKGGDAGTEKYGTESDFARIRKLEDPGFVVDMHDALARVLGIPTVATSSPTSPDSVRGTSSATSSDPVPIEGPVRVLYLGCNTGDEIELVIANPALRDATHVGVDHSASAIAAARERLAAHPTVQLHEADITKLDVLGLGRFDLIISIGTLQSAGLDDRALLRVLVQDYLAAQGSLIIGVPNCRYVDGEVEYGTRMKNFRQPELGLLVKDIAFYRKYLQQHHKQVFVTGKHYVLVTAVPTRGE